MTSACWTLCTNNRIQRYQANICSRCHMNRVKATLRLQTLFPLLELMMSQREDVPNMVVSDTRVKAKETELLTQDRVTSSASWSLGVCSTWPLVFCPAWSTRPATLQGNRLRRDRPGHDVRMSVRRYFYRWHGDHREQHAVTRTSRRCASLMSPLALRVCKALNSQPLSRTSAAQQQMMDPSGSCRNQTHRGKFSAPQLPLSCLTDPPRLPPSVTSPSEKHRRLCCCRCSVKLGGNISPSARRASPWEKQREISACRRGPARPQCWIS